MQKPRLLWLLAVCVMPQKDIWGTANPPTLVGVVKTIEWKTHEIVLQKGPLISWSAGTNVFTQYGGDFDIEDIKPGDEIEVWTPDCRIGRKAKTIKSVVIRVHK